MLSDVYLIFLVVILTEWLTKPLIKTHFKDGDPNQNNLVRFTSLVMAYVFVVLNTLALRGIDWAGAWGLIPPALVVFSGSLAGWHVVTGLVPGLSTDSLATAVPVGTPVTPSAVVAQDVPVKATGAGQAEVVKPSASQGSIVNLPQPQPTNSPVSNGQTLVATTAPDTTPPAPATPSTPLTPPQAQQAPQQVSPPVQSIPLNQIVPPGQTVTLTPTQG